MKIFLLISYLITKNFIEHKHYWRTFFILNPYSADFTFGRGGNQEIQEIEKLEIG